MVEPGFSLRRGQNFLLARNLEIIIKIIYFVSKSDINIFNIN